MNPNYKISVPFMNHTCDSDAHRAQYLELVRRMGARRVFLCMPRPFTDSPERRAALELLAVNAAFFKANGIEEVGTWFTGMGHGGILDHESIEERTDYPRLVGFNGGICDDTFCISDPGYRKMIGNWVRDMGKCGLDIIQLDDDLRLGSRGNGMGCTCDYHMAEFARRTGREWTREALYQEVWSGKPNPTRDAWFALMNESFHGFARVLREKLDSVSPTTRLGFCACMTTYDSDCIDAAELARTFAGNTKPYLRGIGAAYWGNHPGGDSISDVIGYERMERAWMLKAPDIEFYTEGDVYPRPRYRVPGWLLETFDTALRADGSADGILKYVFDYVQTPMYETGYIERHEHNLPLYEEIHNAFDGGRTRGIYVWEAEHKLKDCTLPTPAPSEGMICNSTLSASIRFLNRLCIPTSMIENGDAVCVSGWSGQKFPLDLMKYGVMTDIDAAEALTARGVDCGIAEVTEAPAAEIEIFPAADGMEEEHLRTLTGGQFRCVTLREGATVLSTFRAGDIFYPAAWLYENADGYRFLCYAFSFVHIQDRYAQLLTSYARQAQAIRALEWLQRGKKSAAVCAHHPELYMIVKDLEGGGRAVGMWNCFGDEIIAPTVMLDRVYENVQFLGGACGHIEGDRVVFDSDIPAHAFSGFVVK